MFYPLEVLLVLARSEPMGHLFSFKAFLSMGRARSHPGFDTCVSPFSSFQAT